MEKKLSLRETWEKCVQAWEEIAERWKPGDNIHRIKDVVFYEQGFYNVYNHCFFCDYYRVHGKIFNSKSPCPGCPGTEVAPQFDCCKSGWDTDPPRFYRTLKRMYAKWKKLHPKH